MSLVIPFTPTEEARLADVAKQRGLSSTEFIKTLVQRYLPLTTETSEHNLEVKLREWQQQDGTVLMPPVATQTLFAWWAEEDAQMTDTEREAEEKLWADVEKGIAENGRVVELRRLS